MVEDIEVSMFTVFCGHILFLFLLNLCHKFPLLRVRFADVSNSVAGGNNRKFRHLNIEPKYMRFNISMHCPNLANYFLINNLPLFLLALYPI